MGYPTSPVKLKEPLPLMDLARKLASDVRSGKKTGDKAIRDLIGRLSYDKDDGRMPVYSAKVIGAASDLIYAAEMRSPSYHDTATAEAEMVLKNAVREVMSGT